jgi:type IV pilus assembly protein PilO
MSKPLPAADDSFSDEEKPFFNNGKLDLDALSNASSLVKSGLFLVVTAFTFLILWMLWLSGALQDLERAGAEERQLQALTSVKLLQLAKLEPLAQQRNQTLRAITLVELALSRQGEMAGLLKAINRVGLAQGLQFELFRPEKELIHTHYAELPISLRVSGNYHSLGSFAADIASLPQLVTLDNLWLTPLKEGNLVMDATVHAYRHLEAGDRPILKVLSTEPSESP